MVAIGKLWDAVEEIDKSINQSRGSRPADSNLKGFLAFDSLAYECQAPTKD
jgi:hypothetical protein